MSKADAFVMALFGIFTVCVVLGAIGVFVGLLTG
jgi:hypothetical protein